MGEQEYLTRERKAWTRAEAKRRIRDARAALAQARARFALYRKGLKSRFRKARAALMLRQREERARLLAELRERFARERAALVASHRERRARVVSEWQGRIGKARALLLAEREEQAELRKWQKRRLDTQKAFRASSRERRDESDDEVRGNIDPALLVVFERIKRTIKPERRRSRTEAFLEWCHDHPEEVIAIQVDEAESDAARMIREIEAHERELATVEIEARRATRPKRERRVAPPKPRPPGLSPWELLAELFEGAMGLLERHFHNPPRRVLDEYSGRAEFNAERGRFEVTELLRRWAAARPDWGRLPIEVSRASLRKHQADWRAMHTDGRKSLTAYARTPSAPAAYSLLTGLYPDALRQYVDWERRNARQATGTDNVPF